MSVATVAIALEFAAAAIGITNVCLLIRTMSDRSVLEAVVELDAWLITDMLCWLLIGRLARPV